MIRTLQKTVKFYLIMLGIFFSITPCLIASITEENRQIGLLTNIIRDNKSFIDEHSADYFNFCRRQDV